MTDAAPERYVRSRTISTDAGRVFAVLADPARHRETEPTDWVRDAIDPRPITAVGQVFAINMFIASADRHYVIHNRVRDYEPDRTIGWEPGRLLDDGTVGVGGWWWRYDLAPEGDGTRVSLTYDWSEAAQWARDDIGLPPFPPEFLDASLASLERAATG